MKRFSVGAALLAAILFAGCKSAKLADLQPVDPLSVLSSDSSIYVYVPVPKHQELTKSILCAQIPGLSEKDAGTIVGRISALYAGIGTVSDRSRVELAALGSYPKIAIDNILTRKNGWNQVQ